MGDELSYPIRTSTRTGRRVFNQEQPRCPMCETLNVEVLRSEKPVKVKLANGKDGKVIVRHFRCRECKNFNQQPTTFKASVVKG